MTQDKNTMPEDLTRDLMKIAADEAYERFPDKCLETGRLDQGQVRYGYMSGYLQGYKKCDSRAPVTDDTRPDCSDVSYMCGQTTVTDEAKQRELNAALEWKRAILSVLQSFPEWEKLEWGGDKNGWGFNFEFIKLLKQSAFKSSSTDTKELVLALQKIQKESAHMNGKSSVKLNHIASAALAKHRKNGGA